ncbi:MAG: ABC transporter substrate-binding protein [Candidatus Marithrix sp.]|nr:ABC transporter substrate-binding protein [Candidatus Marithrix sp.]
MKTILQLLSVVFLLTACSQEAPKPPLKIGINFWPGYAHAFIAEKQGLFKKYGVEVELVFKSEMTETTKLYKDRKLDGIFAVLPDVIMFNAEKIPTQVVYVVDYSDGGDLIIGSAELKSLADLKGKTVSFEGINTFSHLLVIKLLEKAGIKEGEFKSANLPVAEVLAALEAGKIDAGHVYSDVTTEALQKGYKILGKAGDIPGIITDVLAFNDNVIKNRPDDVQAVIKACLEANKFLEAFPDKALTIMAKAENTTKEIMKMGLADIHSLDLAENVAALQTGGTLSDVSQEVMNFYLEKGQLPRMINLDKILNERFIQNLAKK